MSGREQGSTSRQLAQYLLCSAAILGSAMHPSIAQETQATKEPATLRILSFNTYREYFNGSIGADASAMSEFLIKGDYDIIALQELCYISDCAYMDDIPALLEDAGKGTYSGSRSGEDGVLSRLPGTPGEFVFGNYFSGQVAHFTTDAQKGVPQTTFVSAHFDWRDEPEAYRIDEAKTLNAWAKEQANPILMMGDFNAGDVSERGLHTAKQQANLFVRTIVDGNSSDLWRNLAAEYTPEGREDEYRAYVQEMQAIDGNGDPHYRNVIQNYFDANPDQYPNLTSISEMSWRQWEEIIAKHMAENGHTFENETYPVESNQPKTMNILKKQFILLNSDSTREGYAPHTQGDGSTTWPMTEQGNTATSWDRSAIDHFLASRPYGKWWEVVDDPSDPYLGVPDETTAVGNDGVTPVSDHGLVAHEVKWVGPALETYAGDDSKKTLIWSKDANTFEEDGKTFYLSRNNMRTDVTLGQISDEDGNPILTGLIEEEKKTVLDCASNDGGLQAAIQEYCIDDHSFIGETQVADGGTVIVDEDAALGGADAILRLNDGVLQIAGTEMNRLGRDVVLEGAGGTLDIVEETNLVTAAGVISGTGALTKAGVGALNLTRVNSYTGVTNVNAGYLFVNGSIASSSLTTVGDGATLAGSGTIGTAVVANGGTLSPGNSIGTLTVAGDLTFARGAVYKVDVDPDGTESDLVDVTGTAALDGGSVAHIGADGDYNLRSSYTILSAGELEGRFEDVTSNFAFLTPDLLYDYDLGRVDLTLARNDRNFASAAETRNQTATARGIESIGIEAENQIYDAIALLPDDGDLIRTSFDQLSGEIHATAKSVLIGDSHIVRDAVSDRIRAAFGGVGASDGPVMAYGRDGAALVAPSEAQGAAATWSHAFGSWGSLDGDRNAAGADTSTGGFLLGVDTAAFDSLRFGFLAGSSHSSFDTDDRSSSGSSDNYHLALYAGTQWGRLGFRSGLAYTLHDIDTNRSVAIPGFSDGLKGGYDAHSLQAFGELGYRIDTAAASFEPFVNLSHVSLHTDSYAEQGGAAALNSSSKSTDTTFAMLGLHASTGFRLAGLSAKARGMIGWRHAFGHTIPHSTHIFAGSEAFTIAGAPVARNAAVIETGFDLNLANSATLGLAYQGQFGGDVQNNSVNARLRVRF